MIEDRTEGHLEEVRAFAEKVGKRDQLENRLAYLGNYSQEPTRCLLFKDWAPQSFAFQMQTKNKNGEWQHWFHGGLIFHGSHDGYGSGGMPTLSCCLTPTDGWSVHT